MNASDFVISSPVSRFKIKLTPISVNSFVINIIAVHKCARAGRLTMCINAIAAWVICFANDCWSDELYVCYVSVWHDHHVICCFYKKCNHKYHAFVGMSACSSEHHQDHHLSNKWMCVMSLCLPVTHVRSWKIRSHHINRNGRNDLSGAKAPTHTSTISQTVLWLSFFWHTCTRLQGILHPMCVRTWFLSRCLVFISQFSSV